MKPFFAIFVLVAINLTSNLSIVAHEVYFPIDPRIDVSYEKANSPVLDLGLAYRYKNHRLGLSYINMINAGMELEEFQYFLRKKGLIANYRNSYGITGKITLIPELYGCLNNEDYYGIATLKMEYSKILQGQILYSTKHSFSFRLSIVPGKMIRLGYYYNQRKNNIYQKTGGFHGLNLGLKLRYE